MLITYWFSRAFLIQYFVESVDLVHTILFIRNLSEFVNNILLLSNFGSSQSLFPKKSLNCMIETRGFIWLRVYFFNRMQFKRLMQDFLLIFAGYWCKTADAVTHIWSLSSKYFISKISHQHRCARKPKYCRGTDIFRKKSSKKKNSN